MPATDIALSAAGPDGAGELLVRGPQLMAGYWNRPEATARALSGGWLHTGDVARITDDGAIQLLDRRDDIVNRGGENVYCAEVENALAAHPAVAEVAVVGLPDDALGRKVAAAVVPLAGASLTPASWSPSPGRRWPASRSPSSSASAPTRCPATPAAR